MSEREALLIQHLQHALLSCHGYRTLCLEKYKIDANANRMGSIMLGEIAQPPPIQPPTQIEVHCLGRFEVSSAFRHMDRWRSVKARSVFQYLLIKPREPTIKEALMDALWPECTPQAAGNNLKAAIHNLRLTLGDLMEETDARPYVFFMQGSYLINPEVKLRIDVEEFEKHWTNGRQMEKERKIAEAMREFESAEALYRGDYLEEEPYAEWTLFRREALKDIYLMILGKLAEYYMLTGDYESCIHYSQKVLAKDQCREDAYQRLMYCYTRLGQRNRALRWYDICCHTIQSQLDATPDDKTSQLYQKILKNEVV